MTENVFWVFILELKGEYDDLVALMEEMAAATEGESGAMNYEWFIDDDRQTVHLYERYRDSAATLEHLGNFSSKFAKRFFSLLKPKSFYVYGAPNERAAAALTGAGATLFKQIGGFAR